MSGAFEEFKKYTRMAHLAWIRRWLAIVTAAVICAVGWGVVYVLPDRYEAMTRVYLDTQSMLQPVLRGIAVDSDVRSAVALTTRRTLLSRPNLEKIVKESALDLEVKTPEDLERVINRLSEKINVKGSSGDGIYVISYQDKNPLLAKSVVEKLLALFVETTLMTARKDTSRTEVFLDQQIDEYEAKLEEAEERLKVFKRKNVGFMPTEAGGYFDRLRIGMEGLERAKLDLREAERRRDELQRQIDGDIPLTQDRMVQGVNDIDNRISGLELTLDGLLLQFTDKHPDVIAAKRTIEQLKAQRDGKLESRKLTQWADGDADNPIFQELKISLGRAEADVSVLKVRVVEHERRVAGLRKLVDVVPRVEAELAKLNRDYTINKQNYEALVVRRESAKISREASQSVDDVQFRIIDPPAVPLVPVWPHRGLFITMVLFLGIGGGVGLAILFGMLKATFITEDDLSQVEGATALGSVTKIVPGSEKRAQKLSLSVFIVACIGLFASYLIVLAIALFDVDALMSIVSTGIGG